MTTPASTALRARIDLSALLTQTARLVPAYRQHISQQRDLLDPEDGAQPDAQRYDEVTEDYNDIIPLCSALLPSEWQEAIARAEKEKNPKAAEWRKETPVHALFDLSSQVGSKGPGVVQTAVAWDRSRSNDPSTEAQLDFLDFLARSKPLVLFENLTYAHPASGSAVLRLDKLQDFTVAALSRYVAHLNEARSVDNPAPGAEQDAADEASEDFNVAGPLQTALDPTRLAEYEGKPLSQDYVRKAGQNLLELNEQVSGKARHVVKSLRTLVGTDKSRSDGSDDDTVCLDFLDFLAAGSRGSRSSLFSIQ